MLVKQQITGLILSGGRGTRVDDQDKGLLNYQGITLMEQQLNWLQPQVGTLLISANRNYDQLERFGHKVIQDVNSQFEGPLQGVLRALQECVTDMLFVQPIDVPDLPGDLIERILTHQSFTRECQYLVSDKREHYLSMLINKKYLGALESFIDKGNRRVRDFHQQIGSIPLNLNISENDFKNLNFTSDYQ